MAQIKEGNRKEKYKTHPSKPKQTTVKELVELLEKYTYIATLNMENLPARQLQTMKENMRGTVIIRLAKKRLITLAINKSKKQGLDKLKSHLKGMPALLFTNESPFKLYAIIKKSKSKAPIKGGQKAPHDITVKAGGTTFAPGPIIGELGAYRIKTGIEGGKVAIKADTIVAREGDVVDQKLASILLRLGIEPMQIGLDITAVYDQGDILTKDVLDIDETAFFQTVVLCERNALALAIEACYITTDTLGLLITKAEREALSLAVESNIPSDKALPFILAKAQAHARELHARSA
jgi:large subunit ribosomal protein L10